VSVETSDRDGEGNPVLQQWTVGCTTYMAEAGYAPGEEVLWRIYPDSDSDSVGSTFDPFTYDAAGRLYAVPGVVSSTTYEADGQVTTLSSPAGCGSNT
jgi:hypothetical protein